MALLVFETICVLACGFFLYVLVQWRRDGKGKTAFQLTAPQKSKWGIRNAPLNVVSFRAAGPADAEDSANGRQCERMAHEQIARAGVAQSRG